MTKPTDAELIERLGARAFACGTHDRPKDAQLYKEAADALERVTRERDEANDVVATMREASASVLGGNCSFVDDDAAVLAAFANWAIENGAPRDICPAIFDKADRHGKLHKRISELEAALRPFAETSDAFTPNPRGPKDTEIWLWCRQHDTGGGIRLSDVRAARRALSKPQDLAGAALEKPAHSDE